ncbi:MAG TPA: hypothetical protein VFP68_05720 [Burkholderiaceae bacterium]|nr:hypothetical protein [Burkholderiaceae bacterium]
MQKPAKYMVIIDAGGSTIARLLDAERRLVAEFDAGSEEVAVMTSGLEPSRGAAGPEWDQALRGHGAEERVLADVYVLDL